MWCELIAGKISLVSGLNNGCDFHNCHNSNFRYLNKNHSGQKSHPKKVTLQYVVGTPSAWIMAHMLTCCGIVFDKCLQCNKIYFHPVLHSFFTKLLYWWWWNLNAVQGLLQYIQHAYIPKILSGVTVWTLWWPIHEWKSMSTFLNTRPWWKMNAHVVSTHGAYAYSVATWGLNLPISENNNIATLTLGMCW